MNIFHNYSLTQHYIIFLSYVQNMFIIPRYPFNWYNIYILSKKIYRINFSFIKQYICVYTYILLNILLYIYIYNLNGCDAANTIHFPLCSLLYVFCVRIPFYCGAEIKCFIDSTFVFLLSRFLLCIFNAISLMHLHPLKRWIGEYKF